MTEQVSAQAMGERANFGQRFGAFLIDIIIIGVVNTIIRLLIDDNVAALISILVFLGYFSYFEATSGQTIGKRALGIRVVDFAGGGGEGLGFGRALIRSLSRYLSGIPCLLGYLWMLWDGQKQTWHDKLSSTTVVRAT